MKMHGKIAEVEFSRELKTKLRERRDGCKLLLGLPSAAEAALFST